MIEQPDLALEILAALQIAAFERLRNGQYKSIGIQPEWLHRCVDPILDDDGTLEPAQRFPYLSAFLDESGTRLERSSEDPARSGVWIESDASGHEMPLRATALNVAGRQLILIEQSTSEFEERQTLYQKARENLLAHERLVREIQQKEVLLHCIIHDLGGPLMGISSSLQWMGQEDLSERAARRLEIGVRASEKLHSLIQDILTVFKTESEPLATDSDLRVDLLESARTVIGILGPAAALRSVRLVEELSPAAGTGWTTAGEPLRAERVLFNLVENAIRHSPEGATVRIRLSSVEGGVEVSVEDEGLGVPEDVVPSLFRKFAQSGNRAGKVGLGLYFCNVMITRWGGKIGYGRPEQPGSQFWFWLPGAGS